jgi:hypothetical protein
VACDALKVIMEAVDGVGLHVPATFFIMLAMEYCWPVRAFPPRRPTDAPGCVTMSARCGD